jgi:homoserine O-acetyltransferase
MLVAAAAAPRSTRARRRETTAPEFVEAHRDVDIAFPRIGRALGVDDPFVRLRFFGREGASVVLVLGGISADRRVADAEDGEGWWRDLVAAGGGVDLARFQIVGADFFPLQPSAPVALSPGDFADVYAAALKRAGVVRLHAVVGGSFGGMIALALARRHPHFVDRIAVLCAAHRPSPLGGALRRIQRDIIALALEAGDGAAGVALARRLAMTTYRTPEEFEARFADGAALDAYLSARGRDYAARMSAARYATLSAAIDAHCETPEEITTPTLIVAASSDQLVPLAECRDLSRRLAGPARLVELRSPFGHDAFLKESERIAAPLAAYLTEPLS